MIWQDAAFALALTLFAMAVIGALIAVADELNKR